MQKKIIALAIASALTVPAMAFADVQVYGLVDVAVANMKADGQKSDTQAISGGLSTSRVGLNSAEDLGNGMKAIVNLEYKIDAGASTALISARQQLLGVAGDFGTVAGGYLQTTAWDFGNSYDPTSGSTVSPLGDMTSGKFLIGSVAAAARAQHALAYISPKFSGVTVAVNYSTNLSDGLGNWGLASNATAKQKTAATLASVNYVGTSLPVAVGFVYAKTSNDSAAPAAAAILTTSEYALGANYDFGVAKIFATYQSSTPTGGAANKAESVSAVIPAGPGAVAVSYAKAKMGNTAAGAAVPGASGETVAYLYNLSKTDTIYAAYSKVSNDSAGSAFSVDNSALAGGATTAGGGSTMIAVGLRKKF